ncbi:MAG: hypothetical protein WEE89_21455 [Gemmatimonadota bacterium]
MEPVPYHIRTEDIDEVLSAYDAPEDLRSSAREHVLRQVTEIDFIVRTSPENPEAPLAELYRAGQVGDQPGDQSYDRREVALAAIEDVLIRDGFIEISADESRIYPVMARPDSERDD